VISVYLAGLNYFLGEESWVTRFLAFLFVTIALGMVMVIMYGAQIQHAGLIGRLQELADQNNLTAAGQAALSNYTAGLHYAGKHQLTIDEAVVYFVWSAASLTYVALIYLTFFYTWRTRLPLRVLP